MHKILKINYFKSKLGKRSNSILETAKTDIKPLLGSPSIVKKTRLETLVSSSVLD